MASLNSPLRVCRGILKELRALKGPEYKQTMAYNYVLEQFRKNQVTGERYCRAQQEALHASNTYLCLLSSTRQHLTLHNLYHAKGSAAQKRWQAWWACGCQPSLEEKGGKNERIKLTEKHAHLKLMYGPHPSLMSC